MRASAGQPVKSWRAGHEKVNGDGNLDDDGKVWFA
jgi:hypothetical protein